MSKDDKNKSGFSRRTFLKGSALSTALSSSLNPSLAKGKTKEPQLLGPGEVPFQIELNGEKTKLRVFPYESLLDVLRNKLGMTGAKKGCDRGACGSCTVLVDGKPRTSCLTLALDVESSSIETVEGLEDKKGDLSLLQERFIQEDAMQCGYCIPGFLMSATSLLETTPSPSPEEIRKALSGNLCRCGSQPHIVTAIMQAIEMGGGK